MTCYETRQQYLRFYDGERLEEAQFQRRIPLKIQYEKLPPSLWEDYFTRHDERYTRVNWPNALANCAANYPNLAACTDIIAAGDLSEAGLNKIMAQGITEEGFPAVLLRALFYTHSPLLIDFVRFLTRTPIMLATTRWRFVYWPRNARHRPMLFSSISPSMMTASARS